MSRKPYLLNLLLLLALLYTSGIHAQPWALAGPDDANQPNYYNAFQNVLATDKAGSFFVAYPDNIRISATVATQKISVRRWRNGAWQQIGGRGFSAGDFDFLHLAVGPGSMPYVIYKDYGNNRKATVKKYDGTSWVDVGTAVSPGTAEYTRIAIDATGNPVVAYVDSAASRKVTVKRWDGAAWQVLGAANFSPAAINGVKLVIGNNSLPQVLVQYYNSIGATAELYRYTGTAWTSLGNPSPTGTSLEWADLALGKGDTAYVAYADLSLGRRAAVSKYNGSAWVSIGSSGISPGTATRLQLVIDTLNGPYLSCVSQPASGIVNSAWPMIRRFNGSSWVVVGPDSFLVRRVIVDAASLALDTDRVVHVLYGDVPYRGKLQLVKLNNGLWAPLGNSRGFSNGPVGSLKLQAAPDGKSAYCMGTSDYYGDYNDSRIYRYDTGWSVIGQSGVSWAGAPADLVVHPDGRPWVVLRDTGNLSLFSVWRYTGSNWVYTGLRDTVESVMSLHISNAGQVYAILTPKFASGVKVYRYTGTGWTVMPGSPVAAPYSIRYARLRTTSTGVPYLLAGNHISTSPNYLYTFQVYRFTGTGWVTVGNLFNSANGVSFAGDPDLAFDTSDVPHVLYVNSAQRAIRIQKYNSTSGIWTDAFPPAASPLYCMDPKMQFGLTGRLYVCYSDISADPNGKATVMQLTGTAWQTVGSGSFSQTRAESPWQALLNNRMLCAFTDGAAYAYKYDCASPTIINTQPSNTIICAGTDAKIGLAATGAVSFRWQYNDGQGWINVPGAGLYTGIGTDTLRLNGVGTSIGGTQYRCVLSNSCGGTNISDIATLLVDTSGGPAPTIAIAANATTVCAGSPVTLTATVANAGLQYTYEWRLNGVPVAGANGPTFTTAIFNQGDTVFGVITRLSACGLSPVSSISNGIVLGLTTTQSPVVSITASPSVNIQAGQPVIFTASLANGGPSPQYQWQRNGVVINGQTGSTYTTTTLADGDAIAVRVVRGDTCAAISTVVSSTLVMHVAAGIGSTSGTKSLQIYPQPAQGYFYTSGLNSMPTGNYRLKLYDYTGQLVLEEHFMLDGTACCHKTTLSATLPTGLYKVVINGAEQIAGGSVMIVR